LPERAGVVVRNPEKTLDSDKKSLEHPFAGTFSLDTFSVLIFKKVKKEFINAYHSATCKKRQEEIDFQVKVSGFGFLPAAQGCMYTRVYHYA